MKNCHCHLTNIDTLSRLIGTRLHTLGLEAFAASIELVLDKDLGQILGKACLEDMCFLLAADTATLNLEDERRQRYWQEFVAEAEKYIGWSVLYRYAASMPNIHLSRVGFYNYGNDSAQDSASYDMPKDQDTARLTQYLASNARYYKSWLLDYLEKDDPELLKPHKIRDRFPCLPRQNDCGPEKSGGGYWAGAIATA